MSAANSFGALSRKVMNSLPKEGIEQLLMCMRGLSEEDYQELLSYLGELNDEKRFRVIQTLSTTPPDGKKKFIAKLRQKFADKNEKTRKAEQVRKAQRAERTKKQLNSSRRIKLRADRQYFSDSDLTGRDPSVRIRLDQNRAKDDSMLTLNTLKKTKSMPHFPTDKDLKWVGDMLTNAHISADSQMHLTALGSNKENSDENYAKIVADKQVTSNQWKRERPNSNWELTKDEQSLEQKLRTSNSIRSLNIMSDDASMSAQSESDEGEDHDQQGMEYDENSTSTMSNNNSVSKSKSQSPSTPKTPKGSTSNSRAHIQRWTKEQDEALRLSVAMHGERNWKAIATQVENRDHAQCLQRWRKVLRPGLVKGHWSYNEDQILQSLVKKGCDNWGQMAAQIVGRTAKQCRERWKNHLDPSINKGPYTPEEDQILLRLQKEVGNKWSHISTCLKGRTEDSVKIRWKSLTQNPRRAQQQRQRKSSNKGSTGSASGSNSTSSSSSRKYNTKKQSSAATPGNNSAPSAGLPSTLGMQVHGKPTLKKESPAFKSEKQLVVGANPAPEQLMKAHSLPEDTVGVFMRQKEFGSGPEELVQGDMRMSIEDPNRVMMYNSLPGSFQEDLHGNNNYLHNGSSAGADPASSSISPYYYEQKATFADMAGQAANYSHDYAPAQHSNTMFQHELSGVMPSGQGSYQHGVSHHHVPSPQSLSHHHNHGNSPYGSHTSGHHLQQSYMKESSHGDNNSGSHRPGMTTPSNVHMHGDPHGSSRMPYDMYNNSAHASHHSQDHGHGHHMHAHHSSSTSSGSLSSLVGLENISSMTGMSMQDNIFRRPSFEELATPSAYHSSFAVSPHQQQQPHHSEMHNHGEPHSISDGTADDLDDLVNSIKSITDGVDLDGGFGSHDNNLEAL